MYTYTQCTFAHMHTYTHAHVHAHIHTYTHTHIHTCTHVHIHIYAHMHTATPPINFLLTMTGHSFIAFSVPLDSVLHGAGGDPHFLVNLPDNSNLCFSLQGEPGFAFNLVTSEIIVINAVFIDAPPRLQDWTTVIGEIGTFLLTCTYMNGEVHTCSTTVNVHVVHDPLHAGVRYLTKDKAVLKIHFNFKDKSIYVSGYGVLNAKRVSSVALKGEQLEVHSSNISHTWASTVSKH